MLSTCAACLRGRTSLVTAEGLRRVAAYHASVVSRGLEDLIVQPPKEGDPVIRSGRAWEAAELRQKSWDDLHGLWFVLLKERNRLHAERLMHQQLKTNMPETSRYKKVKLSMNRIKQVMSQRAHNEYDNPQVKAKLLAFVNAL